MRDVALAPGGVVVILGLLFWGPWRTGTWLYWQYAGVIPGLAMVEIGVWKIARQDCLHIPMSPALRAKLARLVKAKVPHRRRKLRGTQKRFADSTLKSIEDELAVFALLV